jgi:hypothetical protein
MADQKDIIATRLARVRNWIKDTDRMRPRGNGRAVQIDAGIFSVFPRACAPLRRNTDYASVCCPVTSAVFFRSQKGAMLTGRPVAGQHKEGRMGHTRHDLATSRLFGTSRGACPACGEPFA